MTEQQDNKEKGIGERVAEHVTIARHGGKKEEWFGARPFFDWVPDRPYTRALFDFLIVPQNYALVKQNLGRVGSIVRENARGETIEDTRNHEEKLLGDPPKLPDEVKRYRDWPYGGVFGPGLHFALTLMGLSRLTVVYTGQRRLDLKDRNVLTRDPIQMKEVDALLTCHVYDPLLAVIGSEEGENFEELTRRFAKARLTDIINNSTLDQILAAKGAQTNFAYDYDASGNLVRDENNNPVRYEPIELQRIGVKIDGLRVTEYKLTPEIDALFKTRVAASIAAQAADYHRTAGAAYDADDPSRGAREVLWTEKASEEGSKVRYDVHTGKLADSLHDIAVSAGEVAKAFGAFLQQRRNP